MTRQVSRQDFLKVSGAAAASGAALLADPAGIVKTLAAAPPTTLQMWIWETVPQWQKVLAGSGLRQKYPNINIEFTAFNFTTLHQKLITALTAGITSGLPDIARTHPNYYVQLAATGAILDTTKQVGPYRNNIVASRYDGMSLDGKLYGVPDDFGCLLMGYRVDLFEKAGLPTDPAAVAALWPTWADFIKVGQHIKSKLGIAMINVDPTESIPDAVFNAGTTGLVDSSGNMVFDGAAYVERVQQWKNVYQSGVVTTYVDGSPQFWNAHKAGKIATMFYPNWQDFVALPEIPTTKGLWRATLLPVPSKGVPRIAATDGVQLVIPTGVASDRQQLALAAAMYLRLTTKATVSHMDVFSGAFVSYLPGLTAMGGRLSPMLDNQSTYVVYPKAIQDQHMTSLLYSSTHLALAGSLLQTAIFDILTKNAPVAATLKDAADRVRALQKSTRQM